MQSFRFWYWRCKKWNFGFSWKLSCLCLQSKILTSQVCESHGDHVWSMDVLVQSLLYQVLGFISSQSRHSLIQEDQLEVETGSEHEDVALHLDLGDAGGGETVRHGHHPHTGSWDWPRVILIISHQATLHLEILKFDSLKNFIKFQKNVCLRKAPKTWKHSFRD